MMKYANLLLALIFFFLSVSVYGDNRSLDTGAEVYIISPADGSVSASPVRVRFGLSGMGVAPAGVKVNNTGHHHLLVDVDILPDFNIPIPSDEKHRHFGLGQTETVISLSPGYHTLQLILGDYSHIPHKKPVISKKIRIEIK
jgi:hypothetical protein